MRYLDKFLTFIYKFKQDCLFTLIYNVGRKGECQKYEKFVLTLVLLLGLGLSACKRR